MTISLSVAGAAVGLVMIVVLFGWTRAPDIPRDMDHARSTEENCLTCHGPGEENDRPKNHPLNNDCFKCHVWAPEGALQ